MPEKFQHRPGCEDIAAAAAIVEASIDELASLRGTMQQAHEAPDHAQAIAISDLICETTDRVELSMSRVRTNLLHFNRARSAEVAK